MSSSPEPTAESDYRIEKDSMGEIRVPAAAKWRAQTQRAVENFPISGTGIERELIAGLALIKGAGARVRARRGLLDPAKADAIAAAADEVARGDWDREFPIDVFQTGSGTSSNMNTNEVLASLASEKLGVSVHPNDDVNDPLSSNDQFPSAIHVAATKAVVTDLQPALKHLAATLESKAEEFADVVKSGRTHLMDATPVTLGQEFAGYAAQEEFKGKFKVVGQPFSEEKYGVGLKKGDVETCTKVNDALKKAFTDGAWQKAIDDNLGPANYKPGPGNPPTPAECV